MPHLSDVRGGKSAFQLANVLSIVKQTAMATAAKDLKPGDSFWDAISQRVSQLVEEGHKLVPLTMESDNVQKSMLFSLQFASVTNAKSTKLRERHPGLCVSPKSKPPSLSMLRLSANWPSSTKKCKASLAPSGRRTKLSKSPLSRSSSWSVAWKPPRSKPMHSWILRTSSRR